MRDGNNRSLTRKWLSPHKVMKSIGSHAYRFQVPNGIRWHHVVYTTLFKPFGSRDEAQDVEVDDNEIWEVEEIVKLRKIKGVVPHRVRWSGCTEHEDTWKKFDNLDNCAEKHREF